MLANSIIVFAFVMAEFPKFDNVLYEADIYLSDGSGGYSLYSVSHVGLALLLLVVPIEIMGIQQKNTKYSEILRNTCEWIELTARLIITVSSCMDLLWLDQIPIKSK